MTGRHAIPSMKQKQGKTSGWLDTLPKECKEIVQAITLIADPLITGTRSNMGGNGRYGEWWVRISPTTGTAKNCVLIRKYRGNTIAEYPIMEKEVIIYDGPLSI